MRTTLPIGRHLLYANGNLGKSLLWSFLELYALFYLTELLGLSPALAGLLLLVSMIWDAVSDPLMGLVADHLRRRFATVTIYFFIGIPATALSFIALFHLSYLHPSLHLPAVMLCLLLFRSAYTIIDVPHNSMLSFLAGDSRERNNLASLRIFFSSAGRLLVTLIATRALSHSAEEEMNQALAQSSLGLALLYGLSLLLCLTAVRRVRLPASGGGANTASLRPGSVVTFIVTSRPLRRAFLLAAMACLATPAVVNALLFAGKHQDAGDLADLALVVFAAAQAISLAFWPFYANRCKDQRGALCTAFGILALALVLGLSLPLSTANLFVVAALSGCALSGTSMLTWSLLSTAVDQACHGSSARREMSVFGFFTFTHKASQGASQALCGIVLSGLGHAQGGISNMETVYSALLFCALLAVLLALNLMRGKREPLTQAAPQAQIGRV